MNEWRRRAVAVTVAFFVAALVVAGFSGGVASGLTGHAGAASARAKAVSPGPGYKRCGNLRSGGTRLALYARRVSCYKAARIQNAYEHGGPFSSEPGWDEVCLKFFPGWCCGGGGGAVTCEKGHAATVSIADPEAGKRRSGSEARLAGA
jgi:hypothetical protein